MKTNIIEKRKDYIRPKVKYSTHKFDLNSNISNNANKLNESRHFQGRD